MNNNHFSIITPAYNCEKWYRLYLDSVFQQEYDNYDLYYVDDCSTDNTNRLVTDYFEKENFNGKNKYLIRNSFNKGRMNNIYEPIQLLSEDTIVVVLDGDYWLYDLHVLQKLNLIYDEDVWITNGSYIVFPTKQIVSPKINSEFWEGNIRKNTWQLSHLNTFRKKLFDKIKRKDLMTKKGVFFEATSDQATTFPMAEMAGPEHHRVIKDPLYVYNRQNPTSVDRTNRKTQLEVEHEVRHKKPYSRLESL